MKCLTQSWLDQQCGMMENIRQAVVLMQDKEQRDFSPVACWPDPGDIDPALPGMARDAISRQCAVSGDIEDGAGEVLACPVMLDDRLLGAVAVLTTGAGESHRQDTLRLLHDGCAWLTLLIGRESEAGKHYLATMLEMAAMFLEQRESPAADATEQVVTHVIDVLNEHLGTDASSLLQQIHETVHHARGIDAGQARQTTQHDALARDISAALEEDRFILQYQPKVDIETGRIACMEALLRLQHPGSGLLSPCSFLSAAEQSGLMRDIDEWILRAACRQLLEWNDAGHHELSVAVNLSTAGFMQPNLVKRLLIIAADFGIAPARLEIEVTESTVMDNIDTAAAVMRSLHDAGIRISVDDFGTGYSSLNYLQRFPISTVKIDRSFVHDITTDADIATIVRGIIAMAHAAGLDVIAQGVETAAQLEFLRQLHCDHYQGYLFSMPLDADAALALLEAEAAPGSLLEAGGLLP